MTTCLHIEYSYNHTYTNTLDCGVSTWEMFDRKHYDNIIKMCKLCIKFVQTSINFISDLMTIPYTHEGITFNAALNS